jgi:hypothetical protein
MEKHQLAAYLYTVIYLGLLTIVWTKDGPLNKAVKNVLIFLTLANLSQLAFFMMSEKPFHQTFVMTFSCYFSAFVGFTVTLFGKDESKWAIVYRVGGFASMMALVLYLNQ